MKVGDFGLSVSTLARGDTFVTAHGQILGTPAYASPEQLRGDNLDVRADIYSVGATLFTLLTNRAPFEGENAVQVVANAVNQEPKPLTELRAGDVPPALARVVARCLAKEPDGRFPDYEALRDALLPFSSREPEPASIQGRMAAGWIDYLLAFLPPYVTLMLLVGAEELIVRPLVEHTLHAARYHLVLLGFGVVYFTVLEGFWGAGLGKWLKGLRVVRPGGRPPGLGRALVRILIPVLSVEGVRMPLMMALISDTEWTGAQTALFVVGTVVCASIPGLLAVGARREERLRHRLGPRQWHQGPGPAQGRGASLDRACGAAAAPRRRRVVPGALPGLPGGRSRRVARRHRSRAAAPDLAAAAEARSTPPLAGRSPGPAVTVGCRRWTPPRAPGRPSRRRRERPSRAWSGRGGVCPGPPCATGSTTWRRSCGPRPATEPCPLR